MMNDKINVTKKSSGLTEKRYFSGKDYGIGVAGVKTVSFFDEQGKFNPSATVPVYGNIGTPNKISDGDFILEAVKMIAVGILTSADAVNAFNEFHTAMAKGQLLLSDNSKSYLDMNSGEFFSDNNIAVFTASAGGSSINVAKLGGIAVMLRRPVLFPKDSAIFGSLVSRQTNAVATGSIFLVTYMLGRFADSE